MNNLPAEDAKTLTCPQCGNVEVVECGEDVECDVCQLPLEEDE